MRILNQNGEELSSESIDTSIGYLTEEKIVVKHHDAIEGAEGEFHYETIHEYENGGKDVKRVWDVEPVEAKPEWDEYETIQRFIPYSDEELKAKKEVEEEDAKRALAPTNEDLSDGVSELSEYIASLEQRIIELEGGAK
jgi:hypothetical protein|nr:MAG TPA: hypothetical protein [Caudoviricetes sp.]